MGADRPVVLCVLLWAHPGRGDELAAHEDEALALLAERGGTVVVRTRARPDADPQVPDEVHVVTFPHRRALDAYLGDPRRTALAPVRNAVVARSVATEVDLT